MQQDTQTPNPNPPFVETESPVVAPTPSDPVVPTTPPSSPPAPLVNDIKPANNMNKMLIVLGVVVLALIVVTGLYFLMSSKKSAPATNYNNQTPSVNAPSSASPSASPVTQSNVDQTLSNTDSTIQKTVDQANTDLNQVNNTNASQDTTTGL